MKFLCLGYLEPETMDASPKQEVEAALGQCQQHLVELYNTGRVILDAGLGEEHKSVRRVNGKVTVVDGPLVETKERIGSAFIIEADDMEEAIRVASLHPTIQIEAGEQFGWRIEIQPIHYFK